MDTKVRQLVGFKDKWSTEADDRKDAWELANEWLENNTDKEIVTVTPLLGQSRKGYYVGQVVIEFLVEPKKEVKAK